MGNLTNLVYLGAAGNQLSGPIPLEFGRLNRLGVLDLSFNQLSGPIPGDLGNLTNLTDLWLGNNRLSGPIPPELGNLANLVHLYLYTNQLSGRVPSELGDLVNLVELYLDDNTALTGPLPPTLTRLSRLALLGISGSALCAPADATFQAWLAPLDFQGDTCAAPEPVGTFPAQTLREGGGVTAVDVNAYFQDPNGDPLTFTAVSSDNSIVTAAVSGSTVALTPASSGTAAVTVTARDPAGLSATQTIAVTVFPANRPPEPVGTLVRLAIEVGGPAVTVEVSGAFRDPDGDALTYGASSSAPLVASVSVLGSTVTVRPTAEGTATVRVTATDAGGSNGTASQVFTVTVTPPANRRPEAVGVLAPVTLGVDDSAVTVDVASAFHDPDGDVLTYRASSSAPYVVTALAAGARVTLAAVDVGTATVEVTATDPDGLSGVQSFRVRVTAPFTDDPIVPGGDASPGRPLHGASDADRRSADGGGSGALSVDGLKARGRGNAGQGPPYVGVANCACAGVRRGGPDCWFQQRRDTGGLGNTRVAHQRVAARGGDYGTIIHRQQPWVR